MKTIIAILALVCAATVTQAQCLTPTPPPTPVLIALSPYSVSFSTAPAQPPTTGYYAEREPEGGTFAIINFGYPSGVFFDDLMLLPNHTFCYRTRANTACGTSSSETDEVMITMPDGPMPYQGAPDAPSQLNAVIYTGKVLLHWILGAFPAVSGQTQTVQVGRSTDGGLTWRILNTLGNNRASYLDTAVVAGHVYYYEVRSFNEFGWTTGSSGSCGITRTDCGTAWSNITSIGLP